MAEVIELKVAYNITIHMYGLSVSCIYCWNLLQGGDYE